MKIYKNSDEMKGKVSEKYRENTKKNLKNWSILNIC